MFTFKLIRNNNIRNIIILVYYPKNYLALKRFLSINSGTELVDNLNKY